MPLTTVAVMFVSNNLLQKPSENCAINNNLNFLVSQLNVLKYSVSKISIVPENRNSIAIELKLIRKLFDIVIIIGDVRNGAIFQAIAYISGQKLEHNVEFLRLIDITQESPCFLPVSAKLLKASDSKFPIVYFQRIYILQDAHIEELFSRALKKHLEHYRKQESYTKIFDIHINGNKLNILEELTKFNVQVLNENNADTLTISVSSESLEYVVECEKVLRSKLGSNIISSCEKSLLENTIYSSGEKHILQALENIEKCFCMYSPENVFISFNGGKDCTVLLHLVLTVQRRKFAYHKHPLLCLYVRSDNTFKEQDDFIKQCEIFYDLEVVSVSADIKGALNTMLKKRPNMKACFMGSRRSDPYCDGLSVFQMTDPDWPQIMRVSPLLDWHYSDIWDYLLYYKVPYCKLYDMGFTSLGGTLNTIRNPSLISHDVDGQEMYLPAYKMLNEAEERSGRNVSSKI